jgi:hypothetical protein
VPNTPADAFFGAAGYPTDASKSCTACRKAVEFPSVNNSVIYDLILHGMTSCYQYNLPAVTTGLAGRLAQL